MDVCFQQLPYAPVQPVAWHRLLGGCWMIGDRLLPLKTAANLCSPQHSQDRSQKPGPEASSPPDTRERFGVLLVMDARPGHDASFELEYRHRPVEHRLVEHRLVPQVAGILSRVPNHVNHSAEGVAIASVGAASDLPKSGVQSCAGHVRKCVRFVVNIASDLLRMRTANQRERSTRAYPFNSSETHAWQAAAEAE